jgi:hypothetical protein
VDWIHGGARRCWPLAAVGYANQREHLPFLNHGAKKKQSNVLWVFFFNLSQESVVEKVNLREIHFNCKISWSFSSICVSHEHPSIARSTAVEVVVGEEGIVRHGAGCWGAQTAWKRAKLVAACHG